MLSLIPNVCIVVIKDINSIYVRRRILWTQCRYYQVNHEASKMNLVYKWWWLVNGNNSQGNHNGKITTTTTIVIVIITTIIIINNHHIYTMDVSILSFSWRNPIEQSISNRSEHWSTQICSFIGTNQHSNTIIIF